jgi:hypothetical protein
MGLGSCFQRSAAWEEGPWFWPLNKFDNWYLGAGRLRWRTRRRPVAPMATAVILGRKSLSKARKAERRSLSAIAGSV